MNVMKVKGFSLLFWVVGVINIVIFGANILYVCHFYPTRKPVEFDYYGVIIAALSFLVAILAILFGYNIFSLERKIESSIDKKKGEFKRETENAISDAKCQLYYSASLINRESGQIDGEFHNLFLSIEEALKNDVTNDDEYGLIEDRIWEIILYSKQMEEDGYDIKYKEPQLTHYIRISKMMKGDKANEILKYLLSKRNLKDSDR